MAHIQKLGMMNMVMEERGKLTKVAKELIELLDSMEKDNTQENSKCTEIRTKTLDLLKHLTNIAGFCDKDSQNAVREIAELVKSLEVIHFDSLRKICGSAVGLQVDFNKSPFTIIDVNILGNEFKTTSKK